MMGSYGTREYRRIGKDIAVQAVRNSIVHGIESAADRIGGKTRRAS